jgi:hypothetical protein
MDILKSAIKLMSSKDEDPKDPKKPKYPKRVVIFAERPNILYPPTDPGQRANLLKQTNAFVTEAQNVVNFYKRVSPSTVVEILPVYERGDNKTKQKIQDTLYGLTPDDDVMVFGHSGSKFAGIPTPQWASLLEDSNYGNCYLGSCGSEDTATGPWKNVRNLTYRPYSQWLGFNPNSSNITDAMFSRGAQPPPLTNEELIGSYNMPPPNRNDFDREADYRQAVVDHRRNIAAFQAAERTRNNLIQKPIKGQDYQTSKGLLPGMITTPFSFSNPFEYSQRATGLPFTLRPPRPTAKKVDPKNTKKVQSTLSKKK